MARPEANYMCGDCAEEHGGLWPEEHADTAHIAECEICHEEKVLKCWNYWNWPGAPMTLATWIRDMKKTDLEKKLNELDEEVSELSESLDLTDKVHRAYMNRQFRILCYGLAASLAISVALAIFVGLNYIS